MITVAPHTAVAGVYRIVTVAADWLKGIGDRNVVFPISAFATVSLIPSGTR